MIGQPCLSTSIYQLIQHDASNEGKEKKGSINSSNNILLKEHFSLISNNHTKPIKNKEIKKIYKLETELRQKNPTLCNNQTLKFPSLKTFKYKPDISFNGKSDNV